MAIDVSRITRHDGASQHVDFAGTIEALRTAETGYAFDRPVRFAGEIVNSKGILRLEGTLETSYGAKCARCLKDLEVDERLAISEFVYRTAPEGDPDAYTYENERLDLGRILADNLILDLPIRKLCSEDCKGLCDVCGADLNGKPCGCGEKDGDTRLEALKGFKTE
jgi:uncharacterized protein